MTPGPAAATIDPQDRSFSGEHAPRFPYRDCPGASRYCSPCSLPICFAIRLCSMEITERNGVLAGLAVVAAMYASMTRKWWLSGMVLATPALVHHLSLKPELTSGFDVFGLVCSVLFDGFMTVFHPLCHLRTSDDSSGDDFWSALRLSCDWFCLLEYLSIAGPLSAGIDLS